MAVMEVSSHALDQNRTAEIDFEVALFTNCTQDHLDYHKTMEAYKEAKKKLFANLSEEKWALFNADDPASLDFIKATRAKVRTYSIESPADLMAKNVKLSEKGVVFTACFQDERVVCKSPLIGKFNVYNLLSAMGIGLCMGISLEQSAHILKNFKGVKGRLEPVPNQLGLHIFVDHAHGEDALSQVLIALRAIKKGRLFTLFGCGGDRDRDKRAKMGKVVSSYSDEAIITSDNPRSEDPNEIAAEILKGFPRGYPVSVIIDRRCAIEKAIQMAKPQDIILIAGKGHEEQQIFAHQVLPFADTEVAHQICIEKDQSLKCV